VKAAKVFRWLALVPVVLAIVLLFVDWPGLDVHRERFRVVISYTDPARATAVVALILLGGVSLLASIALEVHEFISEQRRFLEKLEATRGN
jgi:hypothetical protein